MEEMKELHVEGLHWDSGCLGYLLQSIDMKRVLSDIGEEGASRDLVRSLHGSPAYEKVGRQPHS
jgi:hypothetical protein